MNKALLILAVILVFGIVSCNKIKDKGAELSHETKRKVKSKSKDLVNGVFPVFDSAVPDTKYNKERFKEYLEIEPTPDVKNIYAYGDFLGIDYKVLLSFRCDTSTLRKIIIKKNLILSEDESTGLHFPEELSWWDKKITEKIKPFKSKEEQVDRQYLWYDERTGIAYYEQFSL